ncbi:inositol monophosphatase family protein [Corynebacterium sp. ES2775-CONJ]|uniref:inositol monophosphatase family protein n=1 Tax=Corynebacterium sp. ES2775-CONJ TaxID=2974029 RepID=UPI00216947FA|nr:inositol monophosphatase family protein [Corynebacterium sp. ES2775-CONJ]MCS4489435.1 inositol monophosphatase family protein [Corynebacterium sp. ES2775-CONJ]
MTDHKNMAEMIPAITKTFCLSHDTDSDPTLAQALVYNAGRLAWRIRETGLSIGYKSNITDVVTQADRAAEDFIAGALRILRPDDGILGEEGSNRVSTSGKTWVIDPVDGTYNFTSNSDYFCSALALKEGDRLHFGAVHRPSMGYTWIGGKDIPTKRDGQELSPLGPHPLPELSLGTYIHPTYLADDAVRDRWLKVATEVATIRILGAASIDLATVAEGGLGLWMQHSVHEWDWLPGLALIHGVGGTGVTVDAGGVLWSIAGHSEAVAAAQALLSD